MPIRVKAQPPVMTDRISGPTQENIKVLGKVQIFGEGHKFDATEKCQIKRGKLEKKSGLQRIYEL